MAKIGGPEPAAAKSARHPVAGEDKQQTQPNQLAQHLKDLCLAVKLGAMFSQQSLTETGALADPTKLQQLLTEAYTVLGQAHNGIDLLYPIPDALSEHEYVLPFELSEADRLAKAGLIIHDSLVQHIKAGDDIQKLSHIGLLLHGAPGTGKSEYARYLKNCLVGKADVVQASVSAIRNSSAPGDAVRRVYSHAGERAARDKKTLILVFEEGDQLFAPFTQGFSQRSLETTVNASKSRVNQSSTEVTTDKQEIDQTGQEILSALKDALNSGLKSVFTIITTNRQNLPDAVIRAGRLLPVSFKPIDIDLTEAEKYPKGGRPDSSISPFNEAARHADVAFWLKVVPAEIAAFYKITMQHCQDPTTAKHVFASHIFPQLKEAE